MPGVILDTTNLLKATLINTPLGMMIALANDTHLLLLEFTDSTDLDQTIRHQATKIKHPIVPGMTAPLCSIKKELSLYFQDNLKKFKTPIKPTGTPFQQHSWQALLKIPHGETRSYAKQANTLGKPMAYRAVAQANGANPIAIVIPCHRVINKSGALGGYNGGIDRKKWLLTHEQSITIPDFN